MNCAVVAGMTGNLLPDLSLSHAVALLAGILLTVLVVLPAALLIRRRLRKQMDAERDHLAGQLAALQAERDGWARASTAHEQSKGEWKRRCEEVVGKYNELARKYNELLRTARTLKQKTQQIPVLVQQTVDLQQRIEQAGRRREELQAQLDRARRLWRDQEQSHLNLQDQLSILQGEAEEHQQTIHDLCQKNQALATEAAQIVDLHVQLEQAGRRHDKLSHEIDSLQQQVQGHVREKQYVQSQVSALQESENAVRLEAEQYRKKLLALQEQYEASATQEAKANQECQQLASQNERLLGENEALKRSKETLEEENRKLQGRIQGLEWDLEKVRCQAPVTAAQEKHTEPERHLSIPASFPGAPILLGLDFGTHSTKLIARRRSDGSDGKARVLFLDEPADGYPSFAAPSLVRLTCDGKLFFGRRALRVSGGHLYRSLKAELLPPSPKGQWGQAVFPGGPRPELLVAAYLSWILGRVRESFGEERLSRLSLNVAAPMDHVGNVGLKERYLHVVHAAWEATFGPGATSVRQGVALDTIRRKFEELLDRKVPGLEQRRFEILPETLAPLVSLLQDPKATPGIYLMVDMGAGTTELSISLVNRQDGAGRIACYFDRSILLGGDQFDANDAENQGKPKSHAEKKTQLESELDKATREVWHEGFKKDKDGKTAKAIWKKLTIILSGGGLRRDGLETVISQAIHRLLDDFFPEEGKFNVCWHSPAGIDFVGEPANLNSEYLAVAHGLSMERQKWPKWDPPGEVDAITPAPVQKDPFAHPVWVAPK